MIYLLIETEKGNNFSMGSLTPYQRMKHLARPAKHVLQVDAKCVSNFMTKQSGWDKVKPTNINPHMP
jgi:hypothetical protein